MDWWTVAITVAIVFAVLITFQRLARGSRYNWGARHLPQDSRSKSRSTYRGQSSGGSDGSMC